MNTERSGRWPEERRRQPAEPRWCKGVFDAEDAVPQTVSV